MMRNDNHGDLITSKSGVVFHALFGKASHLSEMGDRINFEEPSSTAIILERRSFFVDLLSTVCFKGDSNAAEWALLNILSGVYKRADIMPLGKLLKYDIHNFMSN